MLSHKSIWAAVDALAAQCGSSPSGLAKRAGLDPTTFNKSKRISREGKPRWPSTESLAKILHATNTSIGDFVRLLSPDDEGDAPFRIPVIALSQAGGNHFFDEDGYPTGTGWDELAFPDVADASAFALEIGGGDFEPVYRDGDIVVVSPRSGLRRGDRVVARTHEGEIIACQLKRKSARRIEVAALNPNLPGRIFEIEEIAWISRIVWASQ